MSLEAGPASSGWRALVCPGLGSRPEPPAVLGSGSHVSVPGAVAALGGWGYITCDGRGRVWVEHRHVQADDIMMLVLVVNERHGAS